MAFQSIWYYTDIPEKVVNLLEEDLAEKFEPRMEDSKLHGDALNKIKRNSQNTWIPSDHWIGGFVWSYIQKVNRENFLYDLTCIDGESIQFTRYKEGMFYGWHTDSGLSTYSNPQNKNWSSGRLNDKNQANIIATDYINENIELVRKLSFSLQLSDPDEYEGGNVQLIDETGATYVAPRKRGTMILFDSRTQHRVLKVESGVRKSLVGWAVGPRWK